MEFDPVDTPHSSKVAQRRRSEGTETWSNDATVYKYINGATSLSHQGRF
jgi:hypothetical protein